MEPENATDTAAKIAVFLLSPLDAALGLEGTDLNDFYSLAGPGGSQEEAAVKRMRVLGMFWELALANLID